MDVVRIYQFSYLPHPLDHKILRVTLALFSLFPQYLEQNSTQETLNTYLLI